MHDFYYFLSFDLLISRFDYCLKGYLYFQKRLSTNALDVMKGNFPVDKA